MSDEVTTAAQYRELLIYRTKKLVKLLAIGVPDGILAKQVLMVYNAAFGAMPEKMGQAVIDEETTLLRAHGMLCLFCGRAERLGPEQMQMCTTCFAEVRSMDNDDYDPSKQH